MSRSTQQLMRQAYYLGILLLVLHTLPFTNDLVAIITTMDLGGIQLIQWTALGIAIGAYMAYIRRFG